MGRNPMLLLSLAILFKTQVKSLHIRPQACYNTNGDLGTCMFVWECIKSEGTHLGTCADGFLFGSCCAHNDSSNFIQSFESGTLAGSIQTNDLSPSSTKRPQYPSSSSIHPHHTTYNPFHQTTLTTLFKPNFSQEVFHSTEPWISQRPQQTSFTIKSDSPSKPYESSTKPYQTFSSTKKPHFTSSRRPTMSSRRPTMSSRRPTMSSRRPTASSKRPTMSSKRPTTSSKRPTMSSKRPITSSQKPVMTSKRPIITSRRPIITSRRPIMTSKRPITSSKKPVSTSIKPSTEKPTASIKITSPTTFLNTVIPTKSTQSAFVRPRPPDFSTSEKTNAASTTTTAIKDTITTTTKINFYNVTTSSPVTFRPAWEPITKTDSSSISTFHPEEVKTTTPFPVFPCGIPSPHPQKKVVGGKNSAFGSWPWQVSVRRISFFGFSSTHRCGGALISRQWIATAGHCVDDLLLSQIKIRVGEYDFASIQEPHAFVEKGAKKKVVHPKYNFFTYENDLALVQLEEAIDEPHISPICLPPSEENLVGKNGTVTGWGRLSEGGILPSILQEVQVPIISNEKCKNMFLAAGRHEYIPDIFMCAGFEEGGRDSCQGDSGGPLQIQADEGYWFLAGIISWGIGCAEPNMPGVCTRISKFKDWVVQQIT